MYHLTPHCCECESIDWCRTNLMTGYSATAPVSVNSRRVLQTEEPVSTSSACQQSANPYCMRVLERYSRVPEWSFYAIGVGKPLPPVHFPVRCQQNKQQLHIAIPKQTTRTATRKAPTFLRTTKSPKRNMVYETAKQSLACWPTKDFNLHPCHLSHRSD